MPLCKCGCGQKIIFKIHYKYRGIPDFLYGHCPKQKFKKGHPQYNTGRTYFKKGQKPWNFGTKGLMKAWNNGLTKETDSIVKKMSDSLKNHPCYLNHNGIKKLKETSKLKFGKNYEEIYGEEKAREIRLKKSVSIIREKNPFYGRYHTEKTKNKIRQKKIGKKISEEHRKNIIKNHPHLSGSEHPLFGRKISKIRRIKISAGLQGIPIDRWTDFKSPLIKRIRKNSETRLWRRNIFERDNWTCQECYIRGGRLFSHHIRKFSKYPLLRFDTNNGLTLCTLCHNKTIGQEDQFIEHFDKKIQEINIRTSITNIFNTENK